MTAERVDEQLQALGECRARMLPEVSDQRPQAGSALAPVNPAMSIGTDVLGDEITLIIRDPRYGLLTCALSRDVARAIGAGLVRQADEPPPAMGGRA
jgi:hypothetical protein